MLTEETGMRRHVSTFKHLGDALKRTDNTLDDLEGCLCALAEAVRQTIRIAWVCAYHARLSYSTTVHASQPTAVHGTVPAPHPAVHGVAHGTIARIWRCVIAVATDARIGS